MLASQIPSKFTVPFGNSATTQYIRAIPVTTTDPTAASETLGFPPATATPVGAGGTPPDIRDMNGILNQTSGWGWWVAAGGAPVAYDATFQAAVGGYPNGAVVASVAYPGLWWRSTADNNTANPDAGGAGWVAQNRILLSANATFYVSTAGSDSTGNGSSGSPWATLQHAWNVVSQLYDLQGYSITFQMANGTYGAGLSAGTLLPGQNGPSSVVIQGNVGTPDNVVFSASGNLFNVANAQVTMQGFKLASSGGVGINVGTDGQCLFNSLDFGACGNGHLSAIEGGVLQANGNYSITGNASVHAFITQGAIFISNGNTVTMTHGLNFSSEFIRSSMCSNINVTGTNYLDGGTTTGQRWAADMNSVIFTNTGGSAVFFPGNSAGAATTGGQYQ